MNFLPGPVAMAPGVLEALAEPLFNHRSDAFASLLSRVKARLRGMTNAAEVAILMGSGTLANDAIAAHLSGSGLVLTNGEFGERLIRHCRRARRAFAASSAAWGDPLDYDPSLPSTPDWIWAVHCETSTGVLNDIDRLKALAEKHGARLILDCVSSLGAVDVDLTGVHLASAVSGKALAAPSGCAIVFGAEAIEEFVPPYLDLSRYWYGNPHTFNSGLLTALDRALDAPAPQGSGVRVRQALRAARFTLIGDGSAPHIVTVEVWDGLAFGTAMAARGFLLSYESDYLVERNWVQACLMGHHEEAEIDGLIEAMLAVQKEC